ncbi:hypothetical protein BGZ99_005429 [Dissophora globulifera]|uniref:Transmembrane protein 198 n=1 Tax=Dissophora globulifera TaxID=979702 RepID=A0A9P6RJV1_9FUNG|nr:hypothetical protein BGZ99_005429 [Dissophora globulifera]
MTTLTSAAPASSKASDVGDNILDGAKSGPYNLSIQAGIAGAILIVLGLVLCFFGYRIYHVTLFIVGFYFLGNLTYIGMVNAGVSSNTLLLVISIAVGVVGGIFLVFCSRLGVAILGALALYALGLWILGWKPNGVITSNTGRIILLVALAVVGFIAGLFSPDEMVIVGTAIVGAYSFIIGVDFYAHTGFKEEADSFINSKNTIDSHFDNQPAVIYAMLGSFLALAVIGMIVQFYSWGRRRPFRPATVAPMAGAPVAAPVAGAPVYASKPSRFAGFWRRRNYY